MHIMCNIYLNLKKKEMDYLTTHKLLDILILFLKKYK